MERLKWWLLSFAWTALIYSTLSIARPFTEYLRVTIPFTLTINVLILGAVAAAVLWPSVIARESDVIARSRRPMSLRGALKGRRGNLISLLTTAALIAVYIYLLAALKIPEEKIHLIQYGVLAFFLFKALEVDTPAPWPYFGAWTLATLLGWADEGIQHILPGRYFAWSDVGINALAAALALGLVSLRARKSP